MRASIFSASCAALLLSALPAAVQATGCPAHVSRPAVHRRPTHDAGVECPGSCRAHRAYAWRSDRDWSQEDVDSWRRDGRDWSDDRWRRADRGPGERGLYRDGGWRGANGFAREEESWSESAHHQGWRADYGWAAERPMMTDRYGYLTWPGKTHFHNGQPVEAAPEGPPEGPWEVHP